MRGFFLRACAGLITTSASTLFCRVALSGPATLPTLIAPKSTGFLDTGAGGREAFERFGIAANRILTLPFDSDLLFATGFEPD